MTTHPASRACYLKGCRTSGCKTANYQYMSRIRYDYEHGRKRRRDATQTRIHAERLTTLGWSQSQIARAAGIGHRTVGAVLAGAPTVSCRTAAAILNVHIGPPPNAPRDVDATGTVRRLRALAAIGWPIKHLADRIGMYPSALGNIARGELTQVRASTADSVAREYRRLAAIPGPSERARILARRKGWHSPMAWDDIDNPAAAPDIDDLKGTHPGPPIRVDVEEVARLTRAGKSAEQIAEALGCHPRSVIRARARINRAVAA